MVERPCCSRFILKSIELLTIEHSGEWKDLKRDSPADRKLFGFVNHTHTTASELSNNPKVTQCRQRRNRRGIFTLNVHRSLIELRRDSVHEVERFETASQFFRNIVVL